VLEFATSHNMQSDIALIEKLIEEKRSEIKALEHAANLLRERSADGEQPRLCSANEIRPDSFEAMKLKDAVAKFLRINGCEPAHRLNVILPALLRGGAFVGKNAKDYNRNLKNAIRMNSLSWKRGSSLRALFVYDDRKELVWLRNGKEFTRKGI
jgi:hypothetical protein